MVEGVRQLITKNNMSFFFFAVCAFVQLVITENKCNCGNLLFSTLNKCSPSYQLLYTKFCIIIS